MTQIVNPTEEQQAFCREVWEGRPCFLSARAGTGKTSTIKLAVQGQSDIAVVAFNKKNQEDLAKALGTGVKIATLHSLGLAALKTYMTGLKLDVSKLFELTKAASFSGRRSRQKFADTMRAVSAAKNWGIIPKRPEGKTLQFKAGILEDTPENWLKLQEFFELWEADLETAREILRQSNEEFFTERRIDFDDMVYLPVALGLQVFSSSKMIVDEAQDLSPLNLKMLSKTPAKIWYVGDPFQCIYTWRGADDEVLENLDLPVLPLTTCWRCSKEVLRVAQCWVPDIKPRPDAPQGQAIEWLHMPDWNKYQPSVILARRNSALVAIALQLQESNQQVCILGRDVAKTLLDILDSLKGNTQKTLEAETLAWVNKMGDRFPHRAAEFNDYGNCLIALIKSCHGKQAIARAIEKLFTDSPREGTWLLSTIHKAKGQEWPTVWVLGWTATKLVQPWQRKEDRNLRYVAYTRAKEILNVIAETVWNPQIQDWRHL